MPALGHDIDLLDAATVGYLKKISTMPRADLPGVLARRNVWFTPVLLPLAAGIFCLRQAWTGLLPESLYSGAVGEALWAAIGFTLCFVGLAGLLRRFGKKSPGRFVFLDGTYLWEVGLHRIRVMELSRVVGLQEKVYHMNGSPVQRRIVVQSSSGNPVELVSVGKCTREFMVFLKTCIDLRRRRNSSPPGIQPALFPFVDNRGGLAYLAKKLVGKVGQGSVQLKWSEVIEIPTPVFARRQKWMPAWPLKCSCVCAAVFALGLLIAIPLRPFLDEHYRFAAVNASSKRDLGTPEGYLAAYPNGKHADQVKIILDDRSYFVAVEQHSAAALRDYLSNASNVRHRDEAVIGIGRYYDEAVNHVRQLADAQAGDKPLLQGLLALLENLKAKSSPIVYLGFVPHWTVTPDNAVAQEGEANSGAVYMLNNADIQTLSETSLPIDPSAAFTKGQVLRRQAIILQRVRDALSRILSTDLIDLEPGRNADNCEIIIVYDIHPAGRLRLYTRQTQTIAYSTSFDSQIKTVGLLRDYEISWQVRLRPQISGPVYEFSVTSSPGQSLRMTSSANDPAWAPYAVTLYSTFYDFSDELIESAGLAAPPAPTQFRFQEAVGGFR